jgi:hypothetical protein
MQLPFFVFFPPFPASSCPSHVFIKKKQIYLVDAPGHIISTAEENIWQFWVMVLHILVGAN